MHSPTLSTHPLRDFHKIANDYFVQTFERFPEQGSHVGKSEFFARLSANTPATYREHLDFTQETLNRLERLPEDGFYEDEYLDRRGMLALLRTELIVNGACHQWQCNPQTHVNTAIDSLFDLVVRQSTQLKKIAPALESRLAKIPDFLEAALACIREPIPLWSQLAIQSCQGALDFLDGLHPELTTVSNQPQEINALIANAKQAFVHFSKCLKRKKPGAEGGFAVGPERFSALIRERLGMDRSVTELETEGWTLIASLKEELHLESLRMGFRNPQAALHAATQKWNPSQPLLELYQHTTAAIKARTQELSLVTFPQNESLIILPVPPFLRHQFPTAAYYQPPAFSRKQMGIFWVNDLSLQESDPERQQAEIQQHYGLELTAAHEAYPGHHLQFALQNQHPSKLRRLFAHSIFYEGWTLWCEKICVDQGVIDFPEARLMQLHDSLWRAYRIVIDCGLQTGKLSFEDACQILMEGVHFTQARAAGDVNWYTSSPTVPMSYLLGRIEVERLHQHFVREEGWTIQVFNDWMLSHGAIPWRWIVDARFRGKQRPGGKKARSGV